MNARSTELGRLQEIYDVSVKTVKQVKLIGLTKESFLDPEDDETDLIAEGVMNRVFRVTEEFGHLDEDVAAKCGLDCRGARGVRNRLAHVYGEVDREIVWTVVSEELTKIAEGCKVYCEDIGVDIE